MRSLGTAIIELLIATALVLGIFTLTYQQIDSWIPKKPSQLSCQIVKGEVVCSSWTKK